MLGARRARVRAEGAVVERLIAFAESQGIYVAFRPLKRVGYYMHSERLIILNSRKPIATQRVALAHELGHAHHGHDWTRDHDKVRDELEADTYAARLLISLDAYAEAEQLVGCHPGALAKELGVTRRLVELRQADFARDARILATVEQWRDETWAN